jgi:hypothetical protein
MSRDLREQVEWLEKACHDALRSSENERVIDVLVQTLNGVKFLVSQTDPPLVRGLANLASAQADMLLHTLNSQEPAHVVHRGLQSLCAVLVDLRAAIEMKRPRAASPSKGGPFMRS